MHPPRMGEHTAELMHSLGYTEADVAALRARHAIA